MEYHRPEPRRIRLSPEHSTGSLVGGFMDADLFIDLAGAGNVQLPMFDCSVTGGAYLSTPARPFSCGSKGRSTC